MVREIRRSRGPEMGFPILGSRIPRSPVLGFRRFRRSGDGIPILVPRTTYGSPDGVTGVHSRIIIHTLMIPMIPIYPPLGRDVWYYGGIMMMYYIIRYLGMMHPGIPCSGDPVGREIRSPEMGFPSWSGSPDPSTDPHMVLRMVSPVHHVGVVMIHHYSPVPRQEGAYRE